MLCLEVILLLRREKAKGKNQDSREG